MESSNCIRMLICVKSVVLNDRGNSMFSSIGPAQLLVILLIVLVLFGSKRLRALGSDLGAGLRDFRRSITDKTSDRELD